MKKRAFTLIELLIVVAIIAILAAIAVPNFLEAQIRSKIARAKSDLRTLALACETYRIDDSKYPIMPQNPSANNQNIVKAHRWPWEYGQWYMLSTPIAYITAPPKDALFKKANEQWGIWQDYYRCWNLINSANVAISGATPWGYPSTVNYARNGGTILMASVGPDCVEDISDGTAVGTAGRGIGGMCQYDPTNGTISWGDIYYGMGVGFDVSSKMNH